MLKSRLAAVIGAALALFVVAAQPAAAQDDYGRSDRDSADATVQRSEGTRTTREDRARQNRQQRQQRQPAAPTPEELRAGAQVIADAAGVGCQVSEANKLGQMPEGGDVYEAVCASGPGYLLIGTTPPTAGDCVALAGAAVMARETDPTADGGLQCTLPGNMDHLKVISEYARQAGVPCTIDEGLAIAQGRYDVGCPGAIGYWIDQTDAGWVKTSCFELSFQPNRVCRFTTPEEIAGVWTAALAPTAASDCTVGQSRRMGKDVQGRMVYELKCTSDAGYIVRLNDALAAEETLPCATPEAAAIEGGCRLSAGPEGVTDE